MESMSDLVSNIRHLKYVANEVHKMIHMKLSLKELEEEHKTREHPPPPQKHLRPLIQDIRACPDAFEM